MIPARFRELLVGGAFVTQGFDRCLMIMTTSYFEEVYHRINAMNLADPEPHPAVEFLLYSHPSIRRRIRAVESLRP